MVDIFWLVVYGGGHILAGGGWCLVVVDIFWLVVGGGIVYSNPKDQLYHRVNIVI